MERDERSSVRESAGGVDENERHFHRITAWPFVRRRRHWDEEVLSPVNQDLRLELIKRSARFPPFSPRDAAGRQTRWTRISN